jgi:hypothetical protein
LRLSSLSAADTTVLVPGAGATAGDAAVFGPVADRSKPRAQASLGHTTEEPGEEVDSW